MKRTELLTPVKGVGHASLCIVSSTNISKLLFTRYKDAWTFKHSCERLRLVRGQHFSHHIIYGSLFRCSAMRIYRTSKSPSRHLKKKNRIVSVTLKFPLFYGVGGSLLLKHDLRDSILNLNSHFKDKLKSMGLTLNPRDFFAWPVLQDTVRLTPGVH